MANVTPLSQSERAAAVSKLIDWSIQAGKLHRELRFDSFVDAFAFMTKVAMTAESMNHHPEWFNVYNKVTIDLVTHEANDAISQLDIDLAKKINEYANEG